MSKKLILFALFAMITVELLSQRHTLELTFTAIDSAAYVRLDSIKVMNRTQGEETMIYWPDTTLSLEINPGDLLLYVGFATFSTVSIPEANDDISSFAVYHNFPNPMGDQSEISIYTPYAGKVNLMITDLQGKVVLRADRQLDEGHHSFRFIPGGSNFYFLTTSWNGISRSVKMISAGQNDGKTCSLDYIRGDKVGPELKASRQSNDFIVRQSGILDSPVESTTYNFQFATNIPCPETPTVEYKGQVYNTIQVFSQCWLKENLNVGTMILGSEWMDDNGILEKYCYNNEPDSCAKYGGLYYWSEMMQYTTQQGAQGICPPGWHLPTDEEWKVLEGAVDSQYKVGDPEWDNSDVRGNDAGTNLKTTSGWFLNDNGIDLFGFSGLPGGIREYKGSFAYDGAYGFWWTSTESSYVDNALTRCLGYIYTGVSYYHRHKRNGFSVRCLRDY
ncbi:MAG: hypothetical protein KBC43_04745 [Bacteroidales bacterium]|nr:hypothetical protein [Bacteroidales bacterium]